MSKEYCSHGCVLSSRRRGSDGMFCVVVEQVSEVGDGQFLEGFECEEVVFKLYVLRNR